MVDHRNARLAHCNSLNEQKRASMLATATSLYEQPRASVLVTVTSLCEQQRASVLVPPTSLYEQQRASVANWKFRATRRELTANCPVCLFCNEKKLSLCSKLVFSRLTKTKEEPCAVELPRFFLTDKVYNILKDFSKSRTIGKHISLRAAIILLAFGKATNLEIAQKLNHGRHSIGRWRKRWSLSVNALLAIEVQEPHAALERTVADILSDAQRSGAPAKFSTKQIAEIVSTACEEPRLSQRPVETWTGRELAKEAVKRQIVPSISTSRINDFLRLINLKPHRRKYWCFTTEKDHELFRVQTEQITALYLDAKEAYAKRNTRTVCVDEMTSIAANQRRAATKLPLPGNHAKVECQYTRHGTLSLTGSWDVSLGQLIHYSIEETRKNQDFANHIRRTVSLDEKANWIFVMDNLNTHSGEAVVRVVAELLEIDAGTLGDAKKRKGILGSSKTRREFLSDPKHRIRFAYIPKHSSWLNQIEIVFGVIARRLIRNGNFTSKKDLKDKLAAFIRYYNETFAKPIQWQYNGRKTERSQRERPRSWREAGISRRAEQILALVE